MEQKIAPIDDHREREKGVLVYPVYSRRSGGLSIGINLFPDKKCCPFDCPYCEVFPFSTNAVFSLEQMEQDLRVAIAAAWAQQTPIKDICFSGNGEPSLSPAFPQALVRAAAIRGEMAAGAELVLITCGAGLLRTELFALLRDAALGCAFDDGGALRIWLKLDAGTPGWYQKINRAAIPFAPLIARIKAFVACAPVTIQTMLCAVDSESPPSEEAQAWEALALELAAISAEAGGIHAIHLYGKARPAPCDPQAQPLPVSVLEDRARSLRRALAAANATVPTVTVF